MKYKKNWHKQSPNHRNKYRDGCIKKSNCISNDNVFNGKRKTDMSDSRKNNNNNNNNVEKIESKNTTENASFDNKLKSKTEPTIQTNFYSNKKVYQDRFYSQSILQLVRNNVLNIFKHVTEKQAANSNINFMMVNCIFGECNTPQVAYRVLVQDKKSNFDIRDDDQFKKLEQFRALHHVYGAPKSTTDMEKRCSDLNCELKLLSLPPLSSYEKESSPIISSIDKYESSSTTLPLSIQCDLKSSPSPNHKIKHDNFKKYGLAVNNMVNNLHYNVYYFTSESNRIKFVKSRKAVMKYLQSPLESVI